MRVGEEEIGHWVVGRVAHGARRRIGDGFWFRVWLRRSERSSAYNDVVEGRQDVDKSVGLRI